MKTLLVPVQFAARGVTQQLKVEQFLMGSLGHCYLPASQINMKVFLCLKKMKAGLVTPFPFIPANVQKDPVENASSIHCS